MDRRTYLASTATGIALCAAGCSATSDGDTNGSDAEDSDSDADGEPEWELVEIDAPDEVRINERFTMEITVRNTGSVEGSLTTPLYARFAQWDYGEVGDWTFSDVPPGETRTAESNSQYALDYTHTYQFQLGEFEATASIDVGPWQGGIGERYVMPNDVVATVTDIRLTDEYTYESYNGTETERAPSGSQWAFVSFRAENTADAAADAPYSGDIQVVAGQRQYDQTFLAGREGQYESDEIQPGVIRDGWIAYEVSADATVADVEVVYSDLVESGDVRAIWTQQN